jgi:hypothetical protein
MKYIKQLKDEYPIDFFGSMGNTKPKKGMLYFVERRLFNKSFLPVIDFEVYMVVNDKWVRGKLIEPKQGLVKDESIHT